LQKLGSSIFLLPLTNSHDKVYNMNKNDAIDAPELVEDPADSKQRTNYDKVDNEVAMYAGETIVQINEETNKRLKRTIDKRILSVMVVTYFMQSLDKGTMPFASIMGIINDTGLKGPQYSWLTTIIYLVVLCVEYPENYIIQKIPIAKRLAFNIIMWDVILSLHAACRNFTGLVIVRGFLGAFEAVCQPAFVLLTSMWYKREEQAATAIYWYMKNGLQQIVGGILAFGFSFIPASSSIRSWQALFMSYGIITVFWGFFVLWWMPDSPMKAHCFSEEDKKLLVERVRSNRTVYGFALIQLLTTLPSGGLGAFANIIIKSFSFSTWETQLLQSVTGVLQIITMLTASWIDRRYKQTILAMIGAVISTIAGTVVLLTVEFQPSKKVGLLLAYYIMISFWACSGLALSLVTRNVAGQTKKRVVITSNFVFWAAGNSIGPQVFRAKDAPRYFLALTITLGCFLLLVIVLFVLRTYYVWQNKLREVKNTRGEAIADTTHSHAFEDMTDKEDVNFRYNY
ncbi:major facilitator superfamily transporter, partial [Colletotrichum incanum]